MAPRCACTPLPSIYAHIYFFMYLYIFILAGTACTLPAREGTSSLHTPLPSTNTPQWHFHRHLGLSLNVSCRHSPKSPADGHRPARASLDLYGALEHQLDNLRMGHSLLSVPCPRTQEAAGLHLGSKGDAVNNALGLAQLLMPQKWVFQSQNRVYPLGWGCASLQPTPGPPTPRQAPALHQQMLQPKPALCQNKPQSRVLSSGCSSPSCGSSNPHHPPRHGDAGPSLHVIFATYPQADIHRPIPPEAGRIRGPKFNPRGEPQAPVNQGIGESSWSDYSIAKKHLELLY